MKRAQSSYLYQYALPNNTSSQLTKAFSDLPSPYVNFGEFVSAVEPMQSLLPAELHSLLKELKFNPTGPSAIHVRNLPIDLELSPTPTDGRWPKHKTTLISEGALLLVGHLVGFPFGYHYEKEGDIIQSLAPIKGREKAVSNVGSEVDFPLHTENVYFDVRPHFLALFCLRTDQHKTAVNYLADIRDIYPLLSSTDRERLRLADFKTSIPYGFDMPKNYPLWSELKPVLSGPEDYPELCVNLSFTQACSKEGEEALASLKELFSTSEFVRQLFLEQGDLLIFCNRRVLHGRKAFKPLYDQHDRWIQKLYVHLDPWSIRGQMQFKDGYGLV